MFCHTATMGSTMRVGSIDYPLSNTNFRGQSLRVDPKLPLSQSATSPRSLYSPIAANADGLWLDNGLGKITSRRRKVSGSRYSKHNPNPEPLPPAPAAPKTSPRGPPISYQSLHTTNGTVPARTGSQKSFAARTGQIPHSIDLGLANPVILDDSPAVANDNRARSISMDHGTKTKHAHIMKPIKPSVSLSSTSQSRQQSSNTVSLAYDCFPSQRPLPAAINAPKPKSVDLVSKPITADGGDIGKGVGLAARIEWASDRSPLQKLEGKLQDISKEEKRARVQQAEQLLKEAHAAKLAQQASISADHAFSHRPSKQKPDALTTAEQNDMASPSNHEALLPAPSAAGHQDIPSHGNIGNAFEADSSQDLRTLNTLDDSQTSQKKFESFRNSGIHSRSSQKWQRSLGASNHNTADRAVRFEPDQHAGDEIEQFKSPTGNVYGGVLNSLSSQDGRNVITSPHNKQKRFSLQQHSSKGDGPSGDAPTPRSNTFSHNGSKIDTKGLPNTNDGPGDTLSIHGLRDYDKLTKYQDLSKAGTETGVHNQVQSYNPDAVDIGTPLHHKNRLPLKVHQQNGGVQTHSEPLSGKSERLHNLKIGGVARLTLADMAVVGIKPKEKSAWWESPRIESQRRSNSENKRTESSGYDNSYEDGNGKASFPIQGSSSVILDSRSKATRTKQYVGEGAAGRARWSRFAFVRKLQSKPALLLPQVDSVLFLLLIPISVRSFLNTMLTMLTFYVSHTWAKS